jgi:hypothetical protein
MAEHVLTADEAAAVRRLNDAYLRRIRREQDNHFKPQDGRPGRRRGRRAGPCCGRRGPSPPVAAKCPGQRAASAQPCKPT